MQRTIKHELQPQKVVELKNSMTCAVQTQILVANELKDVQLTLEQVENLNGTRPRILIRIKRRIFKRRNAQS